METLEEFIRLLAARNAQIDEEDFTVYDYCGGNYDDAYWMGRDDSEALLARFILKEYFEEKHN